MSNGMKDDGAAAHVWGRAYAAIPKSVFAMACWHLADVASDAGVGNGQAELRFMEEIEALRDNRLISPSQAKRALSILRTEQK